MSVDIKFDVRDEVSECRSKSMDYEGLPASHLTNPHVWQQRKGSVVEVNDGRPSSEKVLGIAFVSFFSFACLQLSFAFVAGSDAMLGDSSAMMVDSFTYFLNWLAEKRKVHLTQATYSAHCSHLSEKQWNLQNQKTILYLELLPPLLSVTTLIIVMTIVTHKAGHILYNDWRHHGDTTDNVPNIDLMFGFSLFNLALDCMNVFCFARSKKIWAPFANEQQISPLINMDHQSSLTKNECDCDNNTEESGSSTTNVMSPHIYNQAYSSVLDTSQVKGTLTEEAHECSAPNSHVHEGSRTNLNMCSAFTHVFADTLRSCAVILAALIAILVDGVTPEVADAVAAVVVAFLILLSLIPLIYGMAQNFSKLRQIQLDEMESDVTVYDAESEL
jgi:Co/Zn/Cd efflux system component